MSDTPTVRRPVDRAAAYQLKREEDHREMLLRTFQSGVNGEYLGHTVAEVEGGWGGSLGESQRIRIRRYLASGGSSFILLHGSKGTGKTTFAVTIASHLVRSLGVPGRFRSAPAFLNELSFRDGDDHNPLRANSEVPVLVLDDLGASNEGLTPHQQRSLWALIEARWSNPNCRTILTTNMSVNKTRDGIGLSDWLGPSAWDRVAKDLVRIEMEGDSFRDSF